MFTVNPYLIVSVPYYRGTPVVSEDGKQVHLFPSEGTSNTPWLFARFNPDNITTTLQFQWVVEKANAEYYYVAGNDSCTFVRTNFKAKNFRLVCVDLTNPSSVSRDENFNY